MYLCIYSCVFLFALNHLNHLGIYHSIPVCVCVPVYVLTSIRRMYDEVCIYVHAYVCALSSPMGSTTRVLAATQVRLSIEFPSFIQNYHRKMVV